MAGEKGFQERLQGLLSGRNTLGNLGLGLLAASGPSAQPRSFGQVLASGTQFASDRQRQAMETQLVQQQLEEQQRRQAAQQALIRAATQRPVGLLASRQQPQQPQPQQGLLGDITDKVQGFFSNPIVQGVGVAAATGFNPLLGLLAAPGIKSDRDRRSNENELLRQELVRGRRQTQAGAQLRQGVASGQVDRNQLMALAAQADPETFNRLFIQQMFTPPQQTDLQRDLASAGIDPSSQLGRRLILLSVVPEPSKFQQFTQALGREPTQAEVVDFFGAGGTTINIGDQQSQKPIPVTQLPNLRLPDGSGVPLGTTFGEAADAGARVFSAADLAKKEKLTTALGIVGDLKNLAIGPEGVFVGVPNNVIGRGVEGFVNILGDLAGTKASINRKTYTDLSQGVLSPLVRSLGESGSLATEDVTRGLKLIADIEGVPESEAVAKSKYAALEEILMRGLSNFDTNTTGGRFRYNPATGQLEPI